MTDIESTPNDLYLAAKYYSSSLGWHIIPTYGTNSDGSCGCNRPEDHQGDDVKGIGKHAAVRGHNRTEITDPSNGNVDLWWSRDPNYNLAVSCEPSGFFVIDIDPRSGGDASFTKLEAMLSVSLPATVEAITGSYVTNGRKARGRHIFLKPPRGVRFPANLSSLDLPGIDIKFHGYVMLSPSRHHSGDVYEWREGRAPWTIEIAEAPDELMSIISKSDGPSMRKSSDGSYQEDFDRIDIDSLLSEGISAGGRSVGVYQLTCAIANKYIDEPDFRSKVINIMIDFNNTKITPPMKLEGSDSLMYHVERALDFVEDNPKYTALPIGRAAHEWMAEQAELRAQMSRAEHSSPPPTLSQDELDHMEYQTQSYSDSDSLEFEGDPVRVSQYVPPIAQPVSPTIIVEESTSEVKAEYIPTAMRNTSPARGMVSASNGYIDTYHSSQVSSAISSGAAAGVKAIDVVLNLPNDVDALTTEAGGDVARRSLTDTGNSRRIVDAFGSTARYTPGLGWFFWDETSWKADSEDLQIRELAKRLPTIISGEVQNYETTEEMSSVVKWAAQAKSLARQEQSIKGAMSDPRVMVPVDNWDSDPTLLGVANGVVDLTTGKLLKGRPDLLLTRRAPVNYVEGARSSRWEDFLDFATDGDKEYQAWLQRAVGYSFTGKKNYDLLFLVYGPGGTGKNTFLEAVVKALGTQQYATAIDSQILAQGDGKSNSTDMYHWAELRGRRFGWADELPESERIKENAVKRLTGSEEISARSPGGRPFTFKSQVKFWISTNHRPIITDDAMWRRIRPIPWMRVPEKPDPSLKDYLFSPEGGLPAVLAWAVEGARIVLNSEEGDAIGWCKVVREAADLYRKNEDRIGMFLDEEITVVPGASVLTKIVYNTYKAWSEERGEKPMSKIAFDRKLTDRGLQVEGTGSRMILHGMEMTNAAPVGAYSGGGPGAAAWNLGRSF